MLSLSSILNPEPSSPPRHPSPLPPHFLPSPAISSPATSYTEELTPAHHTQAPPKKPTARDFRNSGSGGSGFTKIVRPRGPIRYGPYEDLDEESMREIVRFQVTPFKKIRESCVHIPYNSGKKDFFEKTGRESFEVFKYEFKVPGTESEYTVMWDYNIGLVRMTPFFKCCQYSKTMPAKMLSLNPGLKDITHSITGGSITAQGYWMPYSCAKAVCQTFCNKIAGALIPLFGPDFPSLCVPPSSPDYCRMIIDPNTVHAAHLEAEDSRRACFRALESLSMAHQLQLQQQVSGGGGDKGDRTGLEQRSGRVDGQGLMVFRWPEVQNRSSPDEKQSSRQKSHTQRQMYAPMGSGHTHFPPPPLPPMNTSPYPQYMPDPEWHYRSKKMYATPGSDTSRSSSSSISSSGPISSPAYTFRAQPPTSAPRTTSQSRPTSWKPINSPHRQRATPPAPVPTPTPTTSPSSSTPSTPPFYPTANPILSAVPRFAASQPRPHKHVSSTHPEDPHRPWTKRRLEDNTRQHSSPTPPPPQTYLTQSQLHPKTHMSNTQSYRVNPTKASIAEKKAAMLLMNLSVRESERQERTQDNDVRQNEREKELLRKETEAEAFAAVEMLRRKRRRASSM